MEDEDWDLQAVVRGCCGSVRSTAEAAATADPFSFLPVVAKKEKVEEEDDLLRYLPKVFSTQRGVHELEELCKPFFTKSLEQQQQKQLSPEGRPSSCSAAPPRPSFDGGAASLPLQQQQIGEPQARSFSQTPRAKRRKNQQKKVVCQVPADSLSSDMWAWRKYGQKPIKGSPYPRGYYRCSSSKGCLARKQVERSRTDPDTLVITYTAEHNHPVPTHRNSLAGSTRQKFPSSSSSAGSAQNFAGADGGGTSVGASDPEQTSSKGTSSGPLYSPTAAGFSPTTPLTSSMEEELLRPQRLTGRKAEGEEAEEDEEEDEDDEENLLLLEDMEMLGDDDLMFMDFDQLPEPNVATAFNDGFSERYGAPPHPWMPSGAATAAGGG